MGEITKLMLREQGSKCENCGTCSYRVGIFEEEKDKKCPECGSPMHEYARIEL